MVSISNGMEFYSKLELSISRATHCFNFQRAGRLPERILRRKRGHSRFQFPTGWNSTRTCKFKILFWRLFQFPTGWNSTLLSRRSKIYTVLVSIPNGMEFYPLLSDIWLIGNLLFQFPTGWNSTLPCGFERTACRRFQFPTGWNSTNR